jgi:hypothetical protein
MSGYSRSPRVTRGALVSFNLPSTLPQFVLFQYNPETISRSLSSEGAGYGEDRIESSRVKGPPKETIRLDVEFDAVDQLEHPISNPIAVISGIYPQLDALEMMLYPKSELISQNQIKAAAGTIEIFPPQSPFTLFIYGKQRIVPVCLTQFDITEEAHDTNLNPIRAKVTLNLTVMTYNDLDIKHPGYYIFKAHHIMKEVRALMATAKSASSINPMELGMRPI